MNELDLAIINGVNASFNIIKENKLDKEILINIINTFCDKYGTGYTINLLMEHMTSYNDMKNFLED